MWKYDPKKSFYENREECRIVFPEVCESVLVDIVRVAKESYEHPRRDWEFKPEDGRLPNIKSYREYFNCDLRHAVMVVSALFLAHSLKKNKSLVESLGWLFSTNFF